MSYERDLIDLVSNKQREASLLPLDLGGVSGAGGGVGGPPGGFTGYLPQTRVAYDETEAEEDIVVVSGSLVDNLNSIRYRIAELENTTVSGGSGHTIEDESVVLPARTYLNFMGAGVTASDDEANDTTIVTISGGGTADTSISYHTETLSFGYESASAFVITEDGHDAVWILNVTGGYQTAVILPEASQTNKKITITFNVAAGHLYRLYIYKTASDANPYWIMTGGSSALFLSDGNTWFQVSDGLNVSEGKNLVLGSYGWAYPTTSKIIFGDQYMYIYEKYDDMLAISSDGDFSTPLDVFRAGWDATYDNKIAELGDIDNEDHGKYIRIDANGLKIVGGLPTSAAGLTSGQLWSDGGTVKIVA